MTCWNWILYWWHQPEQWFICIKIPLRSTAANTTSAVHAGEQIILTYRTQGPALLDSWICWTQFCLWCPSVHFSTVTLKQVLFSVYNTPVFTLQSSFASLHQRKHCLDIIYRYFEAWHRSNFFVLILTMVSSFIFFVNCLSHAFTLMFCDFRSINSSWA